MGNFSILIAGGGPVSIGSRATEWSRVYQVPRSHPPIEQFYLSHDSS